MAKWWDNPDVPEEIREAAQQAEDAGRVFTDNDTEPGTSGQTTDTRN